MRPKELLQNGHPKYSQRFVIARIGRVLMPEIQIEGDNAISHLAKRFIFPIVK